MSQWVQSKYSKDAKKWEVCSEFDKYYNVKDGMQISPLLKSEYIRCSPPERWETCTRQAMINVDGDGVSLMGEVFVFETGTGDVKSFHRWAWSEKDPDALIIQRRVQS